MVGPTYVQSAPLRAGEVLANHEARLREPAPPTSSQSSSNMSRSLSSQDCGMSPAFLLPRTRNVPCVTSRASQYFAFFPVERAVSCLWKEFSIRLSWRWVHESY